MGVQDLFSQMPVKSAVEQVWRLIGENEQDQAVLRAALDSAEKEIKAWKLRSGQSAVFNDWAVKWYERTGACPWCGEKGELHQSPNLAQASLV